MIASKGIGVCAYCGRKRKLTRDHIPPRNLFPEPRPGDLITVPSCRECNHSAGLDDEYFRMVVVMREDAGGHYGARQSWEKVRRSLRRPEAQGLRASVLRSMHPVMLRSAGGLYLGKWMGITVDAERVNRVAARIVRGLFYHESGHRLPDTYEAFAEVDPMFEPEELGSGDTVRVLGAIQTQPAKIIGNDVFSYRFLCAEDDPGCTFWLMSFYKTLFAMGYTMPMGDLVRERGELGQAAPGRNL